MVRTKGRAAAEPQEQTGTAAATDTAPVEQEPATGDDTSAPAGEDPGAPEGAPAHDTEEGADAPSAAPDAEIGAATAGEEAPSPATIPASVEEHDEPPIDDDNVGEPAGPATIPASVEDHDEPASDAEGPEDEPASPLIPASVEAHDGVLTGDGSGEALPDAGDGVREAPAQSDAASEEAAPQLPAGVAEVLLEVKGPQQGRHRAGRKFGPEAVIIPAAELTNEELAAIKADPHLNVVQREVPTEAPPAHDLGAGTLQGLPVPGYRPQTDEAVTRVTGLKLMEDGVLRALDALAGDAAVDQRWLAIGRTDIERGFMAVNRSVFRPERVRLRNE